MRQYVMAFDAGTTSERAVIFNREGTIVSVAQNCRSMRDVFFPKKKLSTRRQKRWKEERTT